MDDKNYSNSISHLVESLEPVKPMHFSKLVGLILAACLLASAISVMLMGPRGWINSDSSGYYISLLLNCALFVVALIYAIGAGIPDRLSLSKRKPTIAVLAAGITGIIFIFHNAAHQPWLDTNHLAQFAGATFLCASIIWVLSTGFMGGIYLALKRLTPLNPRVALGWGVFAATLLGLINMQLHCPIPELAHKLFGHGLLLIPGTWLTYHWFFRNSFAASNHKR